MLRKHNTSSTSSPQKEVTGEGMKEEQKNMEKDRKETKLKSISEERGSG